MIRTEEKGVAVGSVTDELRPVALNIRTIPWYLRQRLKVYAAQKRVTMDDAVIELIQNGIELGLEDPVKPRKKG